MSVNVFIVLEGEKGFSRFYQLKGGLIILFVRGSIILFIVFFCNNIGFLICVCVWYDNFGKSFLWFLNIIKIYDLFMQEVKIFMCFMWFVVEKGDGLVDCIFMLDLIDLKRMQFKVLFQNRMVEEFGNGYLWFLVVIRFLRKFFMCV